MFEEEAPQLGDLGLCGVVVGQEVRTWVHDWLALELLLWGREGEAESC